MRLKLVFVLLLLNLKSTFADNDTEFKNNLLSEILLRDHERIFLVQDEFKEKKVKLENNVLEFLDDEAVNITVKDNKLTLVVRDDKVTNETIDPTLIFCFKSSTANYTSKACSSGYCDIRAIFIDVGVEFSIINTLIDNNVKSSNGNTFSIEISDEQISMLNGPPNSAVTSCKPDHSQGYWTVKLIDKGDRVVKLTGVEKLFKSVPIEEPALSGAAIGGIAGGVVAFVIVAVLTGVSIWYFCYKRKKDKNDKTEDVEGATKTNTKTVGPSTEAAKPPEVKKEEAKKDAPQLPGQANESWKKDFLTESSSSKPSKKPGEKKSKKSTKSAGKKSGKKSAKSNKKSNKSAK
uniref:Uncharacterized protein n=1 Tax=Panagrolaimus sp. JU765 TaxID=591449 RepID=A0AC34QB48_9BILA